MYNFREATANDLPLLPAIERAAATMFRQSPYPHLADWPLASEHIDPLRDRVWVAVDTSHEPVGFAITRIISYAAHLLEIDVHPAHARRGLGRQLIEYIATWARVQQLTALTLTTFDNVPWNGPYYSRLGFHTIDLDSINAELELIRKAEEKSGLDMAHRICMHKPLIDV